MTDYDPKGKTYSEIHESRLVVRVELYTGKIASAATPGAGTAATPEANVGYWDTLTGGTISRTVTPRKRPGQAHIGKVPALHQSVATVTITRAWNTDETQRQPIGPVIKAWVNGDDSGLQVKLTQMVYNFATKKYDDYDQYIGPVVSYEGPKGNSDGENFVKETLVIDPEDYALL